MIEPMCYVNQSITQFEFFVSINSDEGSWKIIMEEKKQVGKKISWQSSSLRIRHPKSRLDSGIPGTMKNLVRRTLLTFLRVSIDDRIWTRPVWELANSAAAVGPRDGKLESGSPGFFWWVE